MNARKNNKKKNQKTIKTMRPFLTMSVHLVRKSPGIIFEWLLKSLFPDGSVVKAKRNPLCDPSHGLQLQHPVKEIQGAKIRRVGPKKQKLMKFQMLKCLLMIGKEEKVNIIDVSNNAGMLWRESSDM